MKYGCHVADGFKTEPKACKAMFIFDDALAMSGKPRYLTLLPVHTAKTCKVCDLSQLAVETGHYTGGEKRSG